MAYVGSKITHVGIPDTNLNQLTVEQLAQGASLLQRCRIRTSASFRAPRRSAIRRSPSRSCSSRIRSTRRSACIATTSAPPIYHGVYAKLEQRFSRGLSYLVSYTRSKLVDDASSVFDASILTGPVANFPVADSFNRGLERDYSTGDIPHVFVASAVWDLPWAQRRSPAAGRRAGDDWTLTDRHAAVGHADRRHADHELQRVCRIRHAASRIWSAIPSCPTTSARSSRWFNTGAFATAPAVHGRVAARAIRCAGPSYRNLDLAVIRRFPLPREHGAELRAEVFNLTNTPPLGAPNGTFGSAAFGTITSRPAIRESCSWR